MYQADANIGKRVNQDQCKTPRGDEILELCIGHKLRLLNGRLIGDSQGLFTCHQSNGSSTVDYMIASEELFQRFKYFHVHTLDGSLSDHCLLSSLLALNRVNRQDRQTSTKETPPAQYKWDAESIQPFQDALASPDSIEMIETFLHSQIGDNGKDINEAVDYLQSVITKAADGSLRKSRKHNKPAKSKHKNKKWFDKSLHQLRKSVQSKGELLRKYPRDPVIRGSYFKCQKEYNKTRKKKMRPFKEGIIEKLDDLRTNNAKEYWNLVDKLKAESNGGSGKDMATSVDINDWEDYFKTLTNRNTKIENIEMIKQETAELESQATFNKLDFHISEDEIIRGIRQLKSKKSLGPDLIINEML